MDFLSADTFTDRLARLTDEEKKAVKTTAFDLQVNPASPGMSFLKLYKAMHQARANPDARVLPCLSKR